MPKFVALVESSPQLHDSAAQLVRRFLTDHASIDPETEELTVKDSNEVASDSLQSAYDPDATYRTKGIHNHTGYAVNIFETCADTNPVQLITDYKLVKNNVADTTIIKDRLEKVKEQNSNLKDLYLDGGYFGDDVIEKAEKQNVNTHFTNMTGKVSAKIPVTSFVSEDNKIKRCPAGEDAMFSYVGKDGTLSARFCLAKCNGCEYKDICIMKPGKKDSTVRITQKQLKAAKTRDKLNDARVQAINTSKRAAIEETNSVLKRAYGAGKLAVRGMCKSQVVTGLKVLAHNIRQFERWYKGEYRRYPKSKHGSWVIVFPWHRQIDGVTPRWED